MYADKMLIDLLPGVEVCIYRDGRVFLLETTEQWLEPEPEDITQTELGKLWLNFAETNTLPPAFVDVGF